MLLVVHGPSGAGGESTVWKRVLESLRGKTLGPGPPATKSNGRGVLPTPIDRRHLGQALQQQGTCLIHTYVCVCLHYFRQVFEAMSWLHGDYGGRAGAAWSGDKSLLHTGCHVLQRCWEILRHPWPLHLLCCTRSKKPAKL